MTAVNIHTDAYDLKVDRSSGLLGEGGWGNPFRIGTHGNREGVVALYRRLLWKLIENGSVSLSALAELHGKRLGCHCAPAACHADVLSRAAAWADSQGDAIEAEQLAYREDDHEMVIAFYRYIEAVVLCEHNVDAFEEATGGPADVLLDQLASDAIAKGVNPEALEYDATAMEWCGQHNQPAHNGFNPVYSDPRRKPCRHCDEYTVNESRICPDCIEAILNEGDIIKEQMRLAESGQDASYAAAKAALHDEIVDSIQNRSLPHGDEIRTVTCRAQAAVQQGIITEDEARN